MADGIHDGSAAALVTVWHPRGPQVTMPLVSRDHAGMLKEVDAVLAAGWLGQPLAGFDDSEHETEVGFVVKKMKENRNKSTTPVIVLYENNDAKRFGEMFTYLNNQAEIDTFERVSGLILAHIPEYIGKDNPERGARGMDAYIVPVKKPFSVAWVLNPKHDPNEKDVTKKKPKRLFVRWIPHDPEPAPRSQAGKPAGNANAQGGHAPPNGGGGNQFPKDGNELVRRVCDYDAKLAKQGVCRAGQLITDVTAAGVRKGYSPQMAEWAGDAIGFAVQAVKDCEAAYKNSRK